jgi:hypothetical protein
MGGGCLYSSVDSLYFCLDNKVMARLTKSERKVLGKILARARAAKKRKARQNR